MSYNRALIGAFPTQYDGINYVDQLDEFPFGYNGLSGITGTGNELSITHAELGNEDFFKLDDRLVGYPVGCLVNTCHNRPTDEVGLFDLDHYSKGWFGLRGERDEIGIQLHTGYQIQSLGDGTIPYNDRFTVTGSERWTLYLIRSAFLLGWHMRSPLKRLYLPSAL